ncbi:MAG TPA: Fe-S protein assembly co-chaperone HscB [Myxococcales bacterium]
MSARTCWSCGVEHAAAEPLCPACGKVQPPPAAGAQADKFAILGLSPSFDEPDGLDDRFRVFSRKLHPDRFARATPQERRFSLEQTTLLNDAYKTLKDPVRRAEHVLALRGVRGDPVMSPEFLEETMEDRERLVEAKASGEPLDALAQGVREKRDRTLRQVRDLVQQGGDLGQAAELLARMRYYARYLDEVEGRAVEM